jgi:5-methylcytosine-specific restriction endonuclease McrA
MMNRSEAAKAERNARGNSKDRAARRAWIVSPEAGRLVNGEFVLFGGDGQKVPCWHCGAVILAAEVEIDRIEPGASYRRTNIQPACFPCNRGRSNDLSWVGPLARTATA